MQVRPLPRRRYATAAPGTVTQAPWEKIRMRQTARGRGRPRALGAAPPGDGRRQAGRARGA